MARARRSRARSCSASTSPTGIPPSAPRTTARSRSPLDRTGASIPFVRLDLNETPIEEATRCLDAGARGIKLHPRAQGFGATDERLGAGVRARGRAARADPDPRRPRAAADRGRARGARRALPRGAPDHRPRRHRRHGAPRRGDGRPQGRRLRHLDLEPDRPARLPPPGSAGAGRLRLRLSRTASTPSSLYIALRTAMRRRLRRASSCG